jgi:antitoxin HicB
MDGAAPSRNDMAEIYKVPLVLTPQPEGGFTVTSPLLPELVTEGDTVEEAVGNVRDAIDAVIEVYADLNKPLPANLRQDPGGSPIWFEGVIARP